MILGFPWSYSKINYRLYSDYNNSELKYEARRRSKPEAHRSYVTLPLSEPNRLSQWDSGVKLLLAPDAL